MKEYKLVVFGSGGVGKSAITLRFVQGIFVENYEPTIEDFYRKVVEIGGKQVALEIIDTASPAEQFTTMRDLYIKNRHGFMLVYSINSQATFVVLADLHKQIVRVKGDKDVPILLVGNKCDLEDERDTEWDQGANLAHQWGSYSSFMEVSAKTNLNISDAFIHLGHLVQAKNGYFKTSLESCMRVIQSRGHLHQRMVTIVMNGLPRAGKTTTKERLLGRILQLLEVSPSTGVVEPSLKVIITELSRSSAVVSGDQWTLLSLNDESLHLVNAILQAAGNFTSKSRMASVISDITRALKGTQTDPISLPSSTGVSKQLPPSQSTNPQLEASKATADNVSIVRPDQLFNELITTQWDKLHASLEDATTIHFIDTGGQPEFQEILPALLSGHSISMLLFKLHEELKQRYRVEYVSGDGTKSKPYTASCTVEEVLFQSLATVACYGSDTTEADPTHSGSVALLVGTHKDLATEDDIQAAEESLKKNVESAQYFKKNMVHYPFPGKLIFPIDNTQDDDVKKLRTVLEDIIHKRFPRLSLPAPWLLLEIALRKAGVKILTMKDCQKIAKCYGITSKKELKEALRFLHQMAMVRYYPDVKEVKNLIICDLQALFDVITNIIVNTFTFEKAGQVGEQKFKNTGRFSLQEFQQLATSKYSNDLLPPEKLVKLLEHLHILVPIHEAGHDEYFMPCVLQVEDLDDTIVHSLSYPPLIISFECGYCPVGAFSALTVHLLQRSEENSSTLKWKIPHGVTVYRNKIDFRVGHYLDKVTMIAKPTYFEVQYDCSASMLHTPVHTVCSHIRENILDGLETVIRSRNYTCKTTPLIGFYCPRPHCTPTPHIAICEGRNPSVMECISSKEPIGLPSSHFIWFGKNQTVTSISAQEQQTIPIASPQFEKANSSPLQDSSATGDRPTMIELIRFRGRARRINIPIEISTKYYQFGVLLLKDETGARMEAIIHKHMKDAEQINQEIFKQWIAGKGEEPVTWGTLVEVLQDVELTDLASDIADVKLS